MKTTKRTRNLTLNLICECCGKGYKQVASFAKHRQQCGARVAASLCVFVGGGKVPAWVMEAAEGRF